MATATAMRTRTRESAVQSSPPSKIQDLRVLREARQVVRDAEQGAPSLTIDDYVSVIEAASILGVHPDALRRMIRQKRLPATFVHRTYAIERTVVEMFAVNYRRNTGEVLALL